jgi:hypothetical protein
MRLSHSRWIILGAGALALSAVPVSAELTPPCDGFNQTGCHNNIIGIDPVGSGPSGVTTADGEPIGVTSGGAAAPAAANNRLVERLPQKSALPPADCGFGAGPDCKTSGDGVTTSAAGGVTCGVPHSPADGMTRCVVGGASPNTFEVSDELALMKLHAGAHGGMALTPTNGYSVGFFVPPNNTANAWVLGSMPPFPNQGCTVAVWVSETPGGAPVNGETFQSNDKCTGGTSGEGDGGFTLATDPAKGYCTVKPGVRYYFNVQANMPPFVQNEAPWWANVPDRSGVFGWRQIICNEAVNSPLGSATADGSSSAAQTAEWQASIAAGAPEAAAEAAYRAAHPCHICSFNNGSSCISCGGSPVNCNICTDANDPNGPTDPYIPPQ